MKSQKSNEQKKEDLEKFKIHQKALEELERL